MATLSDAVVPLAGAEADSLVERARRGQRDAFEILLEPLIEPGYRLAFSLLRQREAAEDAVQDATLKAWRRIGQLRPGTQTLRPWFLKIIANVCRDQQRVRWWSVILLSHLPSFREGTGEERWDSALDLHRSLATLSHQDRLVLYLVYWLDLPVEEAAAVLGVSHSAAKGRLHRAVVRLRRHAAGSGGTKT